MGHATPAKHAQDVGVVGTRDRRIRTDDARSVDGFDDFHLRVEIPEPARANAEWNVSHLRAVVDQHDQMIGLCQGRFDHVLVAAMKRRELAERQADASATHAGAATMASLSARIRSYARRHSIRPSTHKPRKTQ